MDRHHLFEFSELPGCPRVLRCLVTDYLEMVTALFRPYSREHNLDLLVRAMHSTGTPGFVDLCSGSGGPWFYLLRQIERRAGEDVSVLTDRFPSGEAARRAALTRGLHYVDEPVDARRVPERLQGVRTLFNGLHHFNPEDAQAILRDAVEHGQAIAVFEMLQRTWLTVFRAMLLAISVPLLTPLVKPMTWWRLVLTYLIPIAPLLLLWDAVVSALRCYRPEELRTMVEGFGPLPYTWEAGTYWRHTAAVTYIVGYPGLSRPETAKYARSGT